jgi:hypothetical protein
MAHGAKFPPRATNRKLRNSEAVKGGPLGLSNQEKLKFVFISRKYIKLQVLFHMWS